MYPTFRQFMVQLKSVRENKRKGEKNNAGKLAVVILPMRNHYVDNNCKEDEHSPGNTYQSPKLQQNISDSVSPQAEDAANGQKHCLYIGGAIRNIFCGFRRIEPCKESHDSCCNIDDKDRIRLYTIEVGRKLSHYSMCTGSHSMSP